MVRTILETKVLFSLPEKEYKLAGGTAKLVPSLATIRTKSVIKKDGDDPTIGLYLGSAGSSLSTAFWEIHYSPLNTIQAYRALKLLERCPTVEDDTLCACYYVMSRELDETVKHYLYSLERSGFTNAKECREAILAEKISEHYFVDAFLQIILDNDIPVNDNEIHKEVALGNLTTKSIVAV